MNELKSGAYIEMNGEPYEIVTKDFVKCAQRRPVLACKLRNLITGKVMKYTFQQSESVPEAELEQMKAQYLYKDENCFYFMDNENFEQFSLPKEVVGDKGKFFIEGAQIVILKFKEKPIGIQLPIKIAFKVISAPPGIQGDTAKGGTKDVEIETGCKVRAPLFIKEGEKILVDTRDGSYVERATE